MFRERFGSPIRFFWLAALAVPAVWPQSPAFLRVFSEYQRPGPDGAIVTPDRAGRPREILSPAVARNGYATLMLSVGAGNAAEYQLFIAQNPENTLRVRLYRARHQMVSGMAIPDALEEVKEPVKGGPQNAPGSADTFVMDLFVPAELPAGRYKLEPQLYLGDRWITYPMEVRVVEAKYLQSLDAGGLAAPAEPAAATAFSVFCGLAKESPAAGLTLRGLILRNARQDLSLAEKLRPNAGPPLSEQIEAQWCGAANGPKRAGEAYLRIRDQLFRQTPVRP